uniref:NADH dehydrogenase subunit 6 n=1 Tax=Pachyneuron aphidis TaxID=909094 RepID=A0A6G6D9U3_9HYME|nr:NADH dehydrogenase subunit 6 [Pachyneuron aphidis]
MMKFFTIMQFQFLLITMMFMMMIMIYSIQNLYIHPMNFILNLFIYSIIISLNLSISNSSHWFSYITFLVMIGGMMVIFMYFISFVSNMKFNFNYKILYKFIMKFILIIVLLFMLLFKINYFMMYNNYNEIYNMNYLFKVNYLENKINYIYLSFKNLPTMMSIIYLLLCLSFIVKMILYKKLTLRKIN